MELKSSLTKRTRTTVLRGAKAADFDTAIALGSISTFDPSAAKVAANPLEEMQLAAERAREQGYNDGLAAAMHDVEVATDESNKRVRRALAALTHAVNEYEARETVALAEVENEIVTAAFAIAQSILVRELSTMTDPGAEAIARALAITPGREAAVVRLNPDDAATLNLTELDTNGRKIEIVADPAVEPGGCIVETPRTSIDAQLSTSLANVAAALDLQP